MLLSLEVHELVQQRNACITMTLVPGGIESTALLPWHLTSSLSIMHNKPFVYLLECVGKDHGLDHVRMALPVSADDVLFFHCMNKLLMA